MRATSSRSSTDSRRGRAVACWCVAANVRSNSPTASPRSRGRHCEPCARDGADTLARPRCDRAGRPPVRGAFVELPQCETGPRGPPAGSRFRPCVRTATLRHPMRLSQILIQTLRDDPADAEIPSHKLLARGGYIVKIAAGVYTYAPLM